MTFKEIIIAAIPVLLIIAAGIYVNGFKNWLVWAVSEAEATFGSKTGKLKLRYAYKLAAEHYPMITKFIPFATFSKLVDSALEVMRTMIENNEKIAEAITDRNTKAEDNNE